MKKLKWYCLLTVLLGTCALSGCRSEGAYFAKHPDRYDVENQSEFALMDKAVERSVSVAGIQDRVLPDGRLEVIANVRNRLDRRIQVQVSCVFKDDIGFSTGDETPWRSLILTENAQESVMVTSMNERARRYTFRVRQAR